MDNELLSQYSSLPELRWSYLKLWHNKAKQLSTVEEEDEEEEEEDEDEEEEEEEEKEEKEELVEEELEQE